MSGSSPPVFSQRSTRSAGSGWPKAGAVATGTPSQPSTTTSESTSRTPVVRTCELGSAPKSPVTKDDSMRMRPSESAPSRAGCAKKRKGRSARRSFTKSSASPSGVRRTITPSPPRSTSARTWKRSGPRAPAGGTSSARTSR